MLKGTYAQHAFTTHTYMYVHMTRHMNILKHICAHMQRHTNILTDICMYTCIKALMCSANHFHHSQYIGTYVNA